MINLNVWYRVTPKEQHLQFAKTPILANFGELPFGEIPEPLKFVRPFRKYFSNVVLNPDLYRSLTAL